MRPLLILALAIWLPGCFISRPDLYGSKYMRDQWAAVGGLHGKVVTDCNAQAEHASLSMSGATATGLVICNGRGECKCVIDRFQYASRPSF